MTNPTPQRGKEDKHTCKVCDGPMEWWHSCIVFLRSRINELTAENERLKKDADFAKRAELAVNEFQSKINELTDKIYFCSKTANFMRDRKIELEATVSVLKIALKENRRRLKTYVDHTVVPKSNTKWSDMVSADVEELDWMRGKEAIELADQALDSLEKK